MSSLSMASVTAKRRPIARRRIAPAPKQCETLDGAAALSAISRQGSTRASRMAGAGAKPMDHFALGPAFPDLASGFTTGLAAGGASTVANRRAMPDRPAASFAGAGLSSPSPRLENFDLPSRSPMALPAVCVERGL